MMTKKETAEMENLRKELAIAKAFRFTELVERDVPPPKGGPELTKGWDSHVWGDGYRVDKTCSSSIHHGDGWEKTTSQNPRHLFSTEVLALRAARYELERRFARVLAGIDTEIAKKLLESKG